MEHYNRDNTIFNNRLVGQKMNRRNFILNPEVASFSQWLSHCLTTVIVNLNLKNSKFVRGGLIAQATGVNQLITYYRWNGDWAHNTTLISAFRTQLANELNSNSSQQTLFNVCQEVLVWGGDRNSKNGATPFLQEKLQNGTLREYLAKSKACINLNDADTNNIQAIESMNSMLTKVHAFIADDGFPIYDSRVAAAVAALVEIYRLNNHLNWKTVPAVLKFPSLDRKRTVQHLSATALSHGNMNRNTQEWTDANIRLGWILQEVIQSSQLLKDQGDVPTRMHSLEACLFMMGYDLTCLIDNLPD